MLEEAKCRNCGGPIVPDGSLHRCEYCKATYFSPTVTSVDGDRSSTTTTTLPPPVRSATSTMSSYLPSWSTMSSYLPLVAAYECKIQGKGWLVQRFFRNMFETWLHTIVILVGLVAMIVLILEVIF